MESHITKKQAVQHFRMRYADLKAEAGGKADRWVEWCRFLRANVEDGNLPDAALDWEMPVNAPRPGKKLFPPVHRRADRTKAGSTDLAANNPHNP